MPRGQGESFASALAQHPQLQEADFRGWLHDDGYCVYEAALDPSRVTHVACWAHVRRKFDEATTSDPQLAGEELEWICRLYAIDRAAKASNLDDARLEFANNRAERGLRSIAVGRKKWMQIGNERGGKTAEVF